MALSQLGFLHLSFLFLTTPVTPVYDEPSGCTHTHTHLLANEPFSTQAEREAENHSLLQTQTFHQLLSHRVCLQRRHQHSGAFLRQNHLPAVSPSRWSAGKPSNALQLPSAHSTMRRTGWGGRKHVTLHARPCARLTQQTTRARVVAIVSKVTRLSVKLCGIQRLLICSSFHRSPT